VKNARIIHFLGKNFACAAISPQRAFTYGRKGKKWLIGGILVAGNKRYETGQLICNRMLRQNIARVHGTAREIASSLHVTDTCVSSISALLMFLQRNHIRKNRYGFFIAETQTFKKSGYPHSYTIELMERPAVSPLPA
jgi:hypothetical protein